MFRSLRTKLLASFAPMVVLTFVVGVVMVTLVRLTDEKGRWVTHSQSVLQHANELRHHLVDAEASHRSAVDGRDEKTLERYRAAVRAFWSTSETLRKLVADNPPQVVTVFAQQELFRAWRERVRVVDTDGDYTTLAIADQLGAAFIQVEDRLLADRVASAHLAQENLELATIFAGIALFILSVLCAVIIARGVVRRVGTVARSARDFASGDETSRATVEGGDEVATLATAFNELADRLVEQRHDRELLQELQELLQVSTSLDDAQPILRGILPRLLGAATGAVYLQAASRNVLVRSATWGEGELCERFEPSACWSLRRGRMHRQDPGAPGVPCSHAAPSGMTVCIPLVAHADTVGTLVLSGDSANIRGTLLNAVAETLALALGNLALRETLRNQAIRDPLTGLYNRRYLDETFARELVRVKRKRELLSVVMIDVDHFKRLNDEHGHDVGDAVLTQLAALVRTRYRGSDVACRFGGEEILVLMPEADAEVAATRTEELRTAIQNQRFEHRGAVVQGVSISAGVACYPSHGSDVETLVRQADEALYRAKRDGRNRVVVSRGTSIMTVVS